MARACAGWRPHSASHRSCCSSPRICCWCGRPPPRGAGSSISPFPGVEPAYFGEAAAFQRILRSRNALLRANRTNVSPTLLDTYDEQLASAGARLVTRRRAIVAALGPRVAQIFRSLHGDLPVTLTYDSDAPVAAAGTEGEVAAVLRAGLAHRRRVDGLRGHTTYGPQTDDLEIRLGDRPAREHASQGQLRSLVLALKLAELGNVEASRGRVTGAAARRRPERARSHAPSLPLRDPGGAVLSDRGFGRRSGGGSSPARPSRFSSGGRAADRRSRFFLYSRSAVNARYRKPFGFSEI